MGPGDGRQIWSGTRASYVALSAISILALSLLTSIWLPDASGSVALLGLLSVYLTSQELLMLYVVFAPASCIVDIIRLAGHGAGRGRGWLIFFSILSMLCKLAGALFAWSLHREGSSSAADAAYSSVGASSSRGPAMGQAYPQHDPFAAAYAPPSSPGRSFRPPQQQQQQQQQGQPQQGLSAGGGAAQGQGYQAPAANLPASTAADSLV